MYFIQQLSRMMGLMGLLLATSGCIMVEKIYVPKSDPGLTEAEAIRKVDHYLKRDANVYSDSISGEGVRKIGADANGFTYGKFISLDQNMIHYKAEYCRYQDIEKVYVNTSIMYGLETLMYIFFDPYDVSQIRIQMKHRNVICLSAYKSYIPFFPFYLLARGITWTRECADALEYLRVKSSNQH
jgi:hypothetical protein